MHPVLENDDPGIRVCVQFHPKIGECQEIDFTLNPNIPLRVTIGKLASSFNAVGIPNVYSLQEVLASRQKKLSHRTS